MNPWDIYNSRMRVKGATRREVAKKREARSLDTLLKNNLSYHSVLIDDTPQNIVIIDSDNYDTKIIYSEVFKDIRHGAIIDWEDNKWLVVEKDVNREMYARAKMRQCNYRLRWVSTLDKEPKIVERWVIVEDGTKYLMGESTGNEYVITQGDTRLSVIVPKDSETIVLDRNNRFLIDDYMSKNVLAYKLTKPYKMNGSYDTNGVLHFIVQECNTEDTDNFELHIANYYSYFPGKGKDVPPEEPPIIAPGDKESDRKVWI